MSTGNIEAFAKKIAQDVELQKKVRALQARSPQEAVAALALISAEAGIPVTEAEWLASRNPRNPRNPRDQEASGELSEGDLSAISGGLNLDEILQSFIPAISLPIQDNYH